MSRFASILLLLFLSFGASSNASRVIQHKPTHKMYHRICHLSQTPTFCYNLLSQRPHADLVTLAQFAVDVIRANVSNTVNLINSLILKTKDKDAEANQHYYICLNHFGVEGALSHVDHIEDLLKKKDYTFLNSTASGDIFNCILGESPSDEPYNDPSMLPQYANDVRQVVEIILIISDLLEHPKITH